MEINIIIDEDFKELIDAGWLRDVAGQALAVQGAGSEVELGLVITGDDRVRELNKDYRGKGEPTDVLAFSMLPAQPAEDMLKTDLSSFVIPPDGVLHLGEVIISYSRAVIQAEEHHHSVKKEIAILLVHGLLHLLGYEHDKPTPKRKMTAKEKEILNHIENNTHLLLQ